MSKTNRREQISLAEWVVIILISFTIISNLVHCQTKEEIDEYAYYVCRYYTNKQLNGALISAMIATESSYRVNAVSHMGAYGLLQLRTDAIRDVLRYNPIKCARLTVRSVKTNWRRNVWAGIWYMNQMFINASGDLKEALRMYNRGSSCTNYVYSYAHKVIGNKQ